MTMTSNRTMRYRAAPRTVARMLRSRRHGFTLVELLVVIGIVVLLMTFTVASIDYAMDNERVRSAARQLQSTLAGARDRAIYAGEPRGVRLLVDGTNPRTVDTLIFIQPAPPFPWEGERARMIDLERPDNDGDGTPDDPSVIVVHGGEDTDGDGESDVSPGWWHLKRRGLLTSRARIRIPAGDGGWYEVDTRLIDTTQAVTSDQYLLLTVPYRDPPPSTVNDDDVTVFSGLTYELELPPVPMSEDAMQLPERVVIDLDGSKIPDYWRPSVPLDPEPYGDPYLGFMDILFSPRGTVIGPVASSGLLNFHLCERGAVNRITVDATGAARRPLFEGGIPVIPSDTFEGEPIGDRKIVTLFTRTGGILTSEVDGTDLDGDYAADDPYRFAETGKATSQ